MSTTLDISRELARWYVRRVRYLVVTSVGEGTGLFISAALLLIVAGLFLRTALQARENVSDSVDRLLNSAQMPTTEDEYVIPVGVLSSEFQHDEQLPAACANGSRACRRADDILDNTVRFARIIATAPAQNATTDTEQNAATAKYLTDTVQALELPHGSLATVQGALTEAVGVRDMSASQSNGGCEPEPAAAAVPTGLWALPNPQCRQSAQDVTALQLPSEIVSSAWNAQTSTNVSCSGKTGYTPDCRILTAVRASYSLEAAIRLDYFLHRRPESNDAWRLTAAYFISVDSVFRFWKPGSLDPLVDLPATRLWSARKYFADLVSSPPSYDSISTTQPYLDYAGAGLVQTRCRAVTVPASGTPSAATTAADPQDSTWRAVGVVCTDLALRQPAIALLLQRLEGNPLVRISELDVDRVGTPLSDSLHAGPFFDQDFWALAHSPQWRQLFGSTTSNGSAWRSITRVSGESGDWYAIPLGRDAGTHHILGITPSGARAARTQLFLWTAVGFLACGAIALFTVAGWQSRRVSQVYQNLARLLSLPSAAVEITWGESDREDELLIVFGNDQAEELLQKSLRRFGEARGAGIEWWREFDAKNLRPADPVTKRPITGDAASGFGFEKVRALRRRGALSTYYVKFEHARTLHVWNSESCGTTTQEVRVQWVRVIATPVMSPVWQSTRNDPRATLESSFGVLIPIFDGSEEGRLLNEPDSAKTGPIAPTALNESAVV